MSVILHEGWTRQTQPQLELERNETNKEKNRKPAENKGQRLRLRFLFSSRVSLSSPITAGKREGIILERKPLDQGTADNEAADSSQACNLSNEINLSIASTGRRLSSELVDNHEMRQIRCDRRQHNSRRIGNLQSNQPPRLSEHMGWVPLIHGTSEVSVVKFLHDSLTVVQDSTPLCQTTGDPTTRTSHRTTGELGLHRIADYGLTETKSCSVANYESDDPRNEIQIPEIVCRQG